MTERIWLIGASEGIGAALALRLAQDGHRVALSARSTDRLQALKSELKGKDHLALPVDVADVSSISAAFRRITEEWGGLDTLIYCAGAYDPMNAKTLDLARIETMLDTNITGAFRAVAIVIPTMLKRNAGRIVLVGSVSGYRGLPNAMGYGASKAALHHLAENLRLDLADTNLRVQLVAPGFVRTRLTDKNGFKMPFLMSPEDAARKIADGLATSRFEIHFPWQLSRLLKTLSVLPNALYFRLTQALLKL